MQRDVFRNTQLTLPCARKGSSAALDLDMAITINLKEYRALAACRSDVHAVRGYAASSASANRSSLALRSPRPETSSSARSRDSALLNPPPLTS